MRARRIAAAAVFAFALLVAGCAIRNPSYYSLSIAPELKPGISNGPQPVTIEVRQFETPAYLRQGRIVYREQPEQVGFYEYHRWAVDPGAEVTTAVVDSLRSSHRFSFAEPYDSHHRGDYLLTGRLERLDEIDYGDAVRVEAQLSAELVNLRTGGVVWTGDAWQAANVEKRNMHAIVTGMSHAVSGSIDQLLSEMEQKVPVEDTSSR